MNYKKCIDNSRVYGMILKELVMSNMDSKNRNMVRKAIKNGVTIERREIENYQEFIPIYEETMFKDNADGYYFFKEQYFGAQQLMKDNSCIFYAMKEGIPIAGAIMYYLLLNKEFHLLSNIGFTVSTYRFCLFPRIPTEDCSPIISAFPRFLF